MVTTGENEELEKLTRRAQNNFLDPTHTNDNHDHSTTEYSEMDLIVEEKKSTITCFERRRNTLLVIIIFLCLIIFVLSLILIFGTSFLTTLKSNYFSATNNNNPSGMVGNLFSKSPQLFMDHNDWHFIIRCEGAGYGGPRLKSLRGFPCSHRELCDMIAACIDIKNPTKKCWLEKEGMEIIHGVPKRKMVDDESHDQVFIMTFHTFYVSNMVIECSDDETQTVDYFFIGLDEKGHLLLTEKNASQFAFNLVRGITQNLTPFLETRFTKFECRVLSIFRESWPILSFLLTNGTKIPVPGVQNGHDSWWYHTIVHYNWKLWLTKNERPTKILCGMEIPTSRNSVRWMETSLDIEEEVGQSKLRLRTREGKNKIHTFFLGGKGEELECGVESSSKVKFRWRHNGTPIEAGEASDYRLSTNVREEMDFVQKLIWTNGLLQIIKVDWTTAGFYECVAENLEGFGATQNFQVEVKALNFSQNLETYNNQFDDYEWIKNLDKNPNSVQNPHTHALAPQADFPRIILYRDQWIYPRIRIDHDQWINPRTKIEHVVCWSMKIKSFNIVKCASPQKCKSWLPCIEKPITISGAIGGGGGHGNEDLCSDGNTVVSEHIVRCPIPGPPGQCFMDDFMNYFMDDINSFSIVTTDSIMIECTSVDDKRTIDYVFLGPDRKSKLFSEKTVNSWLSIKVFRRSLFSWHKGSYPEFYHNVNDDDNRWTKVTENGTLYTTENVTIVCRASTFVVDESEAAIKLSYSRNDGSEIVFEMESVKIRDNDNLHERFIQNVQVTEGMTTFSCSAKGHDSLKISRQSFHFTVKEPRFPKIVKNAGQNDSSPNLVKFVPGAENQFVCQAMGDPLPEIRWIDQEVYWSYIEGDGFNYDTESGRVTSSVKTFYDWDNDEKNLTCIAQSWVGEDTLDFTAVIVQS